MAPPKTLIDNILKNAQADFPDLLAVLVTSISPNSSFTESLVPEAIPGLKRHDETVLGHIFSRDLSGYRVFGLIDSPLRIRQNKHVCWSIVEWGLICPPKRCEGNSIDTHLVFDKHGYWDIHNAGCSLTVNGTHIEGPESRSLPRSREILLVLDNKIDIYLYFSNELIDLWDLPTANSQEDSASTHKPSVEWSPLAYRLGKDQNFHFAIDPSQPEPELTFSRHLSEIIPDSGTNYNVLFKNQNTVINWFNDTTSGTKVIMKTVLEPRIWAWGNETRMRLFQHYLCKPNIAKLWYHRENPHRLFLEFLPTAKDLSVFNRQGKSTLTYEEAMRVFKDIGGALKYLHSKEIAHNDVKPHNIIYSKYFGAKLIDFGVSEKFGTSTTCGTTCYIPLERSFPDAPLAGSHTQDVYGLGVVMYWLLGAMPLPTKHWKLLETDEETIKCRRVHFQEFATYQRQWKAPDSPLKALLLKMCHDDPGERPLASQVYDIVHNIPTDQIGGLVVDEET